LAYANRVRGDHADNEEKAIEAYQAALTVQTREAAPQQWAQTELNLGTAYTSRVRGDRADNVEKGIETIQGALSAQSKDSGPVQWALSQSGLGAAYGSRVRGDRADNEKKAIEAYQAALTVLTRDATPVQWAVTHSGLGSVYRDRSHGDHADNEEKAIEAYQAALTIQTREAAPQQWAQIEVDLGKAYELRFRGERADNAERAIEAIEAALTVLSRDSAPVQWTQAEVGLGFAYEFRVHGDQADNAERAIEAFQAAHDVQTREAAPQQWAQIEVDLAGAYGNRVGGDHADNVEKEIEAYRAASTVLTRESAPEQWAAIQGGLGAAYDSRVRGDHADNAEKAVEAYQAALTAVTREATPLPWALDEFNLGGAYTLRVRGDHADNLEKAIEAYQAALSILTREGAPRQYMHLQRLLALLYDLRIRGSTLENQKAAAAAESAAMAAVDDLVGDGLSMQQIEDVIADVGPLYRFAAMRAVQMGNNLDAMLIADRGRARLVSIALRLDAGAQKLPAAQRSKLFDLREQLRSVDAPLRSHGDASLPNGILTDPVAYGEQQQARRDRATALRHQIRELLPPRDAEPFHIPAPPSGGAILLPLVSGDQATLLILTNARIDAVPLPDVSDKALRQFAANWPAKVEAGLWGMLGAPLEQAMDARDIWPGAHLIILPTGLLAQLPFWWVRNPTTGESLADHYNVTIAPSLASLAPRTSTLSPEAPVVAWFNEDAIPELPLTKAARLLFQEAVPSSKVISPNVARSAQSVIASFEGARVWQFWTHGQFDRKDPTRSGLQLAGRTPDGQAVELTVGDLLAAEFGDRGPDLVILSACETALPDTGSNDELIGLPVALIQAGAHGVISAMWPVREDATLLLMSRFHELRKAMPASFALWKSQEWLRTATTKELLDYLNARIAKLGPGRETAEAFEIIVAQLEDEDTYKFEDKPYADPYYWAAFVFTGSDD
jgi:CHAT domain-containing protein